MSSGRRIRIGIVAGISIAVVAALMLAGAVLGRSQGAPAPTATPISTTTSAPTTIPASATPPPPTEAPAKLPSDDSVVASVNGAAITYANWQEAVLLDHLLSGLAGQAPPAPDETLQRLINEELVLKAFPLEDVRETEQLEAHIAALERTWGVEDAAVVAALESIGLDREDFTRSVDRSLDVQVGLDAIQDQGSEPATWLAEQRADANIVIFEDVPAPPAPVAQAAVPTPTPPPVPTRALVLPEVAPDFTVQGARGLEVTLSKQLAQGPVVVVFFRRGGG